MSKMADVSKDTAGRLIASVHRLNAETKLVWPWSELEHSLSFVDLVFCGDVRENGKMRIPCSWVEWKLFMVHSWFQKLCFRTDQTRLKQKTLHFRWEIWVKRFMVVLLEKWFLIKSRLFDASFSSTSTVNRYLGILTQEGKNNKETENNNKQKHCLRCRLWHQINVRRKKHLFSTVLNWWVAIHNWSQPALVVRIQLMFALIQKPTHHVHLTIWTHPSSPVIKCS